MKTKQYRTIIGVDLGDKKHHVCITDKDGTIISEKTIRNNHTQLSTLAHEHKGALFAVEVGVHSPWEEPTDHGKRLQLSGRQCQFSKGRFTRTIASATC